MTKKKPDLDELRAKLARKIAKQSKKPILIAGGGGLTEKQAKMAVKDNEMPPCVGNPKAPCAGNVDMVRIAGYDDKVRCMACNYIHLELVDREAGASAPNPTAPEFVTPKLNTKVEKERRAQILADNAPKGGWSQSPIVAETPDREPVDINKDEPPSVNLEIDKESRRMQILKKYGKLKGGSRYQ